MIDFALIKQSLPYLLRGLKSTLAIALFSSMIGMTLGIILGTIQSSRSPWLRALVTLYVTLIRGTPMLIQIFFVFYVLPQLGLSIPAFWAAILAIGLNSSAYVSQIVKSGISSVGPGQREAALTLGLSNFDIIRYIILPQALTVVLPALGNEFVTLIKDSSLASIIGVNELTKEGTIIKSRTYDAITVLVAVAVLYLIVTTVVSIILNYFERRTGNARHH